MTLKRKVASGTEPRVYYSNSFEALRRQAVMDRLEVNGFFTNENAAQNARRLREINAEIDRELTESMAAQ